MATTFTGVITGGDATSLVIDTCDGAPGCASQTARIDVNAPGIDLTTVPRVRVTVTFRFNFYYDCQEALEISATDQADAGDSGASAGRLLLAVIDGGLPESGIPFAGSPYHVDKVPLGCSTDDVGCVGPPKRDFYALAFKMTNDSASTIQVYMGDTRSWSTGGVEYTVRNLRSFDSCASEDLGNFAYDIAPAHL